MKKLSLMLIVLLVSFFITNTVFSQRVTNLTNVELSGTLEVTGATSIGALTATGALTGTSGTFTGAMVLGTTVSADSAVTIGLDVFTTTAETDTVTIAGALTTDMYIVTGVFTSAVDQQDVLQVEPLAGKLVVHRLAAGESALEYIWMRFKTH